MVRPNRTSPEAKTSLADSRPSANTAVEWPARPAEILRRASMPLTSIPAVATRCPVDILVWGARSLCPGGVDLLGVDAQLGEGRLGLTGVELAVARQPRQRRGHNRFGVDLEVPPQMLAIVAAAEAIGPQCLHAAGQPWRDLVGHYLHVIGDGDDRPLGAPQPFDDVGRLLRLVRVRAVPTPLAEGIAPQSVVAGDAPHIRGNVVFIGQDLLRAQSLIQDGAAAKQLHGGVAMLGHFVPIDAFENFLRGEAGGA